MSQKNQNGQKRLMGVPKRVWLLMAALLVVAILGIFISRSIYYADLKPVNTSQKTQIFTVESGSSVKNIASDLQDDRLIRSAWAFQLYIHSKELSGSLQAGTYALSPSQSTPEIVNTMTKGKIATKLVTILPGRRIDQIRADLINNGFMPKDVDAALNPARYADMPALAYKPKNVNTLEGLLWPDSFQKDSTTSPSFIIRESLNEMADHLTPDVQAAFARQGLTTYQGLILASIVEQEVNRPADKPQAAQVFMSRLKSDIPLGSDATNRYGAVINGLAPVLTYDSDYNTHLHKGLPPTPISTVSLSSLLAVAHPAKTHWLYFVSGDNGNTYFSTSLEDHEAYTAKYCHKLCSQ